MTDLSPAADAVLDAFWNGLDCGDDWDKANLAAALRAAADQVQMEKPLGDTDADAGVFAAHHAIHAQILAIAAELEGQ